MIIDIFVATCKLSSGDLILDLGCGSGVFSKILINRGYRCVGVDLCRKQLSYGRSNGRGVTFVNGDAEVLPLADNQIDGVLLVGLIHHLPDPS